MTFSFDLPPYRLQKLLASDKFCHFFQAMRVDNGHTVMIQVFNAALQNNKTFRNQFDNIGRFLSGKNFGVITPVIECGWSDGCAYLVCSPFAFRAGNNDSLPRLPLQNVIAAGIRIAHTLSALHKAGLVYCAIEPRYLAFSKQARVTLAPLPLQRMLPVLRKPALNVLQAEQRLYLAPEAERECTAATDFYALGVVMFRMMFNRSPFSSSEDNALRLEKSEFKKAPVSDDFAFLSDFFTRLLHADPTQRISDAEQFRISLEACGIDLSGARITLPPKTPAEPKMAQDRAMETQRQTTRLTPGSKLLAVTAILGLAAGWWFVHDEAPPPAAPATNQPAPDTTVKQLELPTPDNRQEAERFYIQALQAFNQGNFASALLTANNALREYPEHDAALRLKQDAIREIELLPLFRAAQRQLESLRLSWPPGDNASETYRDIAARLPANDDRAQKGFTAIADRHHDLARDDLAREDFSGALQRVQAGLELAPTHAALLNLQETIQARMQALAVGAEYERMLEQQRRAQELQQRQLEQAQKREEFRRIVEAREARERQLEQQRQQQLERQKLIEANRYNVNRLLASVRSYLVSSNLGLQSLAAARMDYAEAISLADPTDERLALYKRDLINAHVALAQRLKSEQSHKDAMQTVDRGLELNENDLDLVVLKNELKDLLSDAAGDRKP
jgi:serine/threonine protein kinase